MRALAGISFSLVLTAVACGGSTPPPATTPDAPKPPAADAAPPTAAADAGAAPAVTVESHRDPFMQLCMKNIPAPDYCDCAWGEFKKVFSADDLAKDLPVEDPRFAKLQQQTLTACGSKVPESIVHDAHINDCTRKDKRRTAYCDCAWTSLRKKLAVTDLLGGAGGDRLKEARAGIAKDCKGKLPKDSVKLEFMQDCTRSDEKRTKACECAWKKVSAKFSIEEIASGAADLEKVPGLDQCKDAK